MSNPSKPDPWGVGAFSSHQASTWKGWNHTACSVPASSVGWVFRILGLGYELKQGMQSPFCPPFCPSQKALQGQLSPRIQALSLNPAKPSMETPSLLNQVAFGCPLVMLRLPNIIPPARTEPMLRPSMKGRTLSGTETQVCTNPWLGSPKPGPTP